MLCSSCLRDSKIVARGYCRACYSRWQRRGTTDYAVRQKTFCQIDECGKPVVSNGLCDMHRKRLKRTGTPDQSSWGVRKKHPLYYSWAHMRRFRTVQPIDDRWNEFLNFVVDVGERPSKKHKFFAANEALPIGPGNFVWKEAVTQKVDGEDQKTWRRYTCHTKAHGVWIGGAQ
jgi:hypothetical protein